MPSSHRHTTGWRRDLSNGRLYVDYEGDPVAYFNGSGMVVESGETLAISGTLSGAGAMDLSAGTVTLPTRSAFFDCGPNVLGADGAALAASETAGDFFRTVGTNQVWIQGEATAMETEVSVGYFTFVLPENYLAGGTVSIDVSTDITGSGTLGTCTIDFSAYLMTLATGAVGSDLVTTAATAITATGATNSFTVTPTGLVAGDQLIVKMTSSIEETMNMAVQVIITRLGVTVQVNK